MISLLIRLSMHTTYFETYNLLTAEHPARTMLLYTLYSEYRVLFLSRTQNSELTQDLLSYILKPREEAEEGCPYTSGRQSVFRRAICSPRMGSPCPTRPGWPILSPSSHPMISISISSSSGPYTGTLTLNKGVFFRLS